MNCVGLERATPRPDKIGNACIFKFRFSVHENVKGKKRNWVKETVAKRVLVWILKLNFNQVMTGDAKKDERTTDWLADWKREKGREMKKKNHLKWEKWGMFMIPFKCIKYDMNFHFLNYWVFEATEQKRWRLTVKYEPEAEKKSLKYKEKLTG